jgi:hypothetical protein
MFKLSPNDNWRGTVHNKKKWQSLCAQQLPPSILPVKNCRMWLSVTCIEGRSMADRSTARTTHPRSNEVMNRTDMGILFYPILAMFLDITDPDP